MAEPSDTHAAVRTLNTTASTKHGAPSIRSPMPATRVAQPPTRTQATTGPRFTILLAQQARRPNDDVQQVRRACCRPHGMDHD